MLSAIVRCFGKRNCAMLFSRVVLCCRWARAAHRSGGSARHVVGKHARARRVLEPTLLATDFHATPYTTGLKSPFAET